MFNGTVGNLVTAFALGTFRVTLVRYIAAFVAASVLLYAGEFGDRISLVQEREAREHRIAERERLARSTVSGYAITPETGITSRPNFGASVAPCDLVRAELGKAIRLFIQENDCHVPDLRTAGAWLEMPHCRK